jgi:hypothetical protein
LHHVLDTIHLAVLANQILLANAKAMIGWQSVEESGNRVPVVKQLCVDIITNIEEYAQTWSSVRAHLADDDKHVHFAVQLQVLDRIMYWVLHEWVPMSKQHLVETVAKHIAEITENLKKKTPVWSHLVTNTKYNANLCKKHLLIPSLSESLEVATDTDFYLVSSLTAACDTLMVKELAAENVTLAEAEGVIEHARLTMTVMASVSLVEVLHKQQSTDDNASQAEKLLEAKGVPDALRSRLKALQEAKR